jgi:putative spermidine/putrescine transport system substrate-binding protein
MYRTWIALVATLALVLTACTSGGAATATPTSAPPTSAESPSAPAESPSAPAEESPSEVPTEGGELPVPSGALTELGEGEGQVNVIAWAGYVEDGSNDPAVDWVTGFEEETGCQVNVTLGNTSDEMFTLMQSGNHDLVSASGDASNRLIAAGEVSPVNLNLIPNYADVFEGLKDQPHNTVDDVPYGVPHGRGANLLMYNTETVQPAPDSWSIVWEPDSEWADQVTGKVTAYDSPIYIADAAVYLMATKPELGITNPYALDETQFQAAVDLLTQQRPLIGRYWALYTDEIAAFQGGDSTVGTTWQVIVNVLTAGEDPTPVEAVLPKEGSTGWSDTWMISSKAANPNCAYMFMNHIISPQTNATATEYFGEAPSNSKACALTTDPNHCENYHATDEEYFSKVHYWATPQQECIDGRGAICVDYAQWTQAWTEIKG